MFTLGSREGVNVMHALAGKKKEPQRLVNFPQINKALNHQSNEKGGKNA